MDKNADGWSSRAYSAPPSSQPTPQAAPSGRSPVLVGAGLFMLGVSSLWAILRLVPVSTVPPAAPAPALPPPAAIDPPRAVERAHQRPMEAEDPAEMAARYAAAEEARAQAAQGRQAPEPSFELEREPAAAAPGATRRLKPSTFRRASSLGQAPARPRQADGAMAALGAAGVLNGIPPQLTAIAAREVASHPQSIPVLVKLVEYAKLDDQSGAFRQATRLCGSLYRCVPRGVGRTDFILESGLKVAYTYVPSAAWGLRNQFHISSPDGQTAQYMDSPLVFDLTGEGLRTRAPVAFDLAGEGRARRVRDLAGAVLAFDRDGDGSSGVDGRELLGNRTDLDGDGRPDGYPDGFAALRALAGPAGEDGRLDAEELAALSRERGLRLLLGGLKGRATRLDAAGVTAVRLSAAPVRRERDFDGWGDDLMTQEGAVFERADGSTGAYADAWLRYLPTPPSPPAHLAKLPD